MGYLYSKWSFWVHCWWCVCVCNFNLYKSMFQYEVEMDIILQFMKIFNLCQFGHGYI